MKKYNQTLQHKFVEFIPDDLADGVIYVSLTYAVAIHKCCCGCNCDIVTPLSPHGWQLMFDGDSVSLHPSIGNWQFKCKSHYWITNNRVRWELSSSPEIKGHSKIGQTIDDKSITLLNRMSIVIKKMFFGPIDILRGRGRSRS